jgi:hypothetical protein
MGVSETVLAAMIGAGATLFTAVFHLLGSFRKASGERRTARNSFRSLLWMLALMVAAGVGGFAYAEYRAQQSRDDARALRAELQQQMQTLVASAARLEELRLPAPGAGGSVTESAAAVSLPPCTGAQVGFATQRGPCTEQEALQVAVCAPVPAAARVTAVELFARPEDSQQPWAESRVAAGQETAAGRFAGSHFERPDSEGSKLVCQSFAHWNSTKGRAVRILVRFGA